MGSETIFKIGDKVKWTGHSGLITHISMLTNKAIVMDFNGCNYDIPLEFLKKDDSEVTPEDLSLVGRLLGLIECPETVTALSNGQLLGLFRRISNRHEFDKEVEQLSFHLTKEILCRMKNISESEVAGYHE